MNAERVQNKLLLVAQSNYFLKYQIFNPFIFRRNAYEFKIQVHNKKQTSNYGRRFQTADWWEM